jgi:P4 family phage/plasmid primase-like protien
MVKTEIDTLVKDFRTFVNNHRCDKTQMTHTTLIKGEGGRYCFVGKDYQDFMEKYSKVVKSGADIDLHFVERPNRNGVTFLLLDVDYDHNESPRVYTDEHIEQIIKKTNKFIKTNFVVTDHQLTSFVTEKPKPSKRQGNNIHKDGFHVYYPFLPMDEKQRYFVLDYLSSLMVKNVFLQGITYENAPESIFDMSIIKSNGILMIGSKKQGGMPYRLTHVYDSSVIDQGIDEYDDEELIYTLSNQKYDSEAAIEACPEARPKIDNVYNQYDGGNKKKNKKVNATKSINKSKEENISIPKKKTVQESRDIEIARALCKILSKKRASDYKSWTRVGYALRAIDDSLFDDFVIFSKKDMAKYNEGNVTCEDVWRIANDFKQFYSTVSIRHWARLDNSTEYYKILRVLNDDIFGKAETSKHVDIAQIIYELYKDRFVCIDIQKKKWYEFQNHRWVLVQSGYTLEEVISDEVRKMLRMYCSEKLRDATLDEDSFNVDNDTKRYQKLMKMIDNLGDVKFRENVVRACSNKFFDASFQAKLDTNTYLVGFLNGVYDLKEMCFRDGLPTDYVSKTVGYDWREFKEDDPIIVRINKYFSQVQTETDMREYLLTFIASALRGISDNKFHIWTGGGGNGKSATISLIKNMLGEYFGTVPVTILTRKRGSSSNATPEMADKFGKRFLVIQEPEHNDVVYVGQMKEYTGGDVIMARPLYGDPFEFLPQFKLVLICNNLPFIPANDGGTWRRLRVTPFESSFVDKKPKGPKQFRKDEELQEEFPQWAQPMIWLVITKYYPIFAAGIKQHDIDEDDAADNKRDQEEDLQDNETEEEREKNKNKMCRFKIHEPDKIKQFTKNYKMDSDFYMEFIEENLIKTNNNNDSETIPFLFDTFRSWYTASYTEKPPAKKTFVAYFKKEHYKVDKQKIYGVKFALGMD